MLNVTRTIDTAVRDARAARLRAEGKHYRTIATIEGCSLGEAHNRVRRAIAAVPVEAVIELRRVEDERLDEMWRVAWDHLHTDHVLVQQGRVIKDPTTGEPMIDQAGKLAALDRLLSIQKRRSDLWGLDTVARERLGLDLRALEIEEAKVDIVRQAIESTLTELGVDPALGRPVLAKHLRAIEAGSV